MTFDPRSAGLAAALMILEPAGIAAANSPAFVCRNPDGRTVVKTAADGPAGTCQVAELPVPPAAIRWGQWLPHAAEPGASLVLDGTGQGLEFTPGSARWHRSDAPPDRGPALPLGTNLLAVAALRPFGAEERTTTARSGEAIRIACSVGSKPAGVVLDLSPQRLPDGARLRIRLQADRAPGFRAGVAPRGGTPEHWTDLGAGGGDIDPAGAPGDAWWLVIACPDDPGELSLESAVLVPEPAPSRPVGYAAWAWAPHLWRDEGVRLLARASALGLDRLFVAVAIADGAIRDEAAFGRFVADARRLGIAVTVVEGDPAMALPEGRAVALRRLEALRTYQARAPEPARLEGVQYDIEPYILPAYAAEPAVVQRGWGDTIAALGAASGPLALDFVLPFWLAGDEAAGAVLPQLQRTAASITIMAYRTAPEAVQAAAEPLLAWASHQGIPARVALEAGPLGNEVARTYTPSPEGDVWVVPIPDGAVALILNGRMRLPVGQGFALAREDVSPADRVSFLGDQARMRAVANHSLTMFRAWSAFEGFAFHGLFP